MPVRYFQNQIMHKTVHVAVAVIRDQNGKVFITRRPDHVHQGGLWEFPGGKVEPGESLLDALRREIKEENDILILDAEPLIKIPFRYSDKAVILDVWDVLRYSGNPHGKEGQLSQWVDSKTLREIAFPAANRAIVSAIQLPHAFLVTPEPGNNKDLFLNNLEKTITDGLRWLYLRAKTLSTGEYNSLANQVCEICRKLDAIVMLDTDADFVKSQNVSGLHVTAKQLMYLNERPVSENQWFSASCHSRDEVEQANYLGADFILIGSVSRTSSHVGSNPIGWDEFSRLANIATMPVFAIGGMTEQDLRQSRMMGGQGIAAIRSLWK